MVQHKKIMIVCTSVLFLLSSACADRDQILNQKNNDDARFDMQMDTGSERMLDGLPHRNSTMTPMNRYALNTDAVIPYKFIDNIAYVPLSRIIELAQFHSDYNPETNSILIGDNDALYELVIDSNKARYEEEWLDFSQKTVELDDEVYVPVNTVQQLFSDQMSFEAQESQLLLHANPENLLINGESQNDENFFQDDPNDPFRDEEAWLPVGEQSASSANDTTKTALKNINITSMINKAKDYLGVDYEFGADPYPVSKKFDCSSYTQYIFDKYGISLPRLSRNQAKEGVAVSRKNLRKGDLLFFYVPGRFKTNQTVGHVGIYIGDNQMIHASPAPKDGVQITNINKTYWKDTYLKARRVAY